jgi:hypothetical protein
LPHEVFIGALLSSSEHFPVLTHYEAICAQLGVIEAQEREEQRRTAAAEEEAHVK